MSEFMSESSLTAKQIAPVCFPPLSIFAVYQLWTSGLEGQGELHCSGVSGRTQPHFRTCGQGTILMVEDLKVCCVVHVRVVSRDQRNIGLWRMRRS
jgi:hypothetical protein